MEIATTCVLLLARTTAEDRCGRCYQDRLFVHCIQGRQDAPFRWLHPRQARRILQKLFGPPLLFGMIWSKVSCSGGILLPQYWQYGPSRMSRRVLKLCLLCGVSAIMAKPLVIDAQSRIMLQRSRCYSIRCYETRRVRAEKMRRFGFSKVFPNYIPFRIFKWQ
jgi:hypothetical protein